MQNAPVGEEGRGGPWRGRGQAPPAAERQAGPRVTRWPFWDQQSSLRLTRRHTLRTAPGLQPLPGPQSRWAPWTWGQEEDPGVGTAGRDEPQSLGLVIPGLLPSPPSAQRKERAFPPPPAPLAPKLLFWPLDSSSSSAQKPRKPFSGLKGHLTAATRARGAPTASPALSVWQTPVSAPTGVCSSGPLLAPRPTAGSSARTRESALLGASPRNPTRLPQRGSKNLPSMSPPPNLPPSALPMSWVLCGLCLATAQEPALHRGRSALRLA